MLMVSCRVVDVPLLSSVADGIHASQELVGPTLNNNTILNSTTLTLMPMLAILCLSVQFRGMAGLCMLRREEAT